MRITCVGGGPAGLYFAVLAKLADPANEVTVLERNPRGVTVFHLGGGKGGSDDSLFTYKAGFAPGRHPFHTWRVVADPAAYRSLVAGRRPGADPDDRSGTFPPYR